MDIETLGFQEISEGDLITFTRRTAEGKTVNQLAYVTRENPISDDDEAPTSTLEAYPITPKSKLPDIQRAKIGLPASIMSKAGLNEKYIIIDLPVELTRADFTDGETFKIGNFEKKIQTQIFAKIDEWEKKGLSFFTTRCINK